MASSQAKTGRERMRTRQKENSQSEPFQPDPEEGILEKQQKNEKKQKNVIVVSFQAKTGKDRLRMRKKKIFSFRSIPTRPGIGNSKKIAKKFEK